MAASHGELAAGSASRLGLELPVRATRLRLADPSNGRGPGAFPGTTAFSFAESEISRKQSSEAEAAEPGYHVSLRTMGRSLILIYYVCMGALASAVKPSVLPVRSSSPLHA